LFRFFKSLLKGLETETLFYNNKLLILGTVLYIAIQPSYLLIHNDAIKSLEPFAFVIGLLSKIFILLGLLRLIATAASAYIEESKERNAFHKTKETIRELSHELATPIGEINGYLVILLDKAPVKGIFTHSLHALQNAILRVDAILEAHKEALLSSGVWAKLSIEDLNNLGLEEQEVTSANTLAEIAVRAVRITRGEAISFVYQYSGNCCIFCRKNEVVQVLINLLRNAIDSIVGDEGRITIHTSSHCGTELSSCDFWAIRDKKRDFDSTNKTESGFISIVIHDEGKGIPQNTMDKIFQRGFTTKGGTGRGFGMAIAKELTESNSGRIIVRSPTIKRDRIAYGTEVAVLFPRVKCTKE
jgi:signal transduction histidine kinase